MVFGQHDLIPLKVFCFVILYLVSAAGMIPLLVLVRNGGSSGRVSGGKIPTQQCLGLRVKIQHQTLFGFFSSQALAMVGLGFIGWCPAAGSGMELI